MTTDKIREQTRLRLKAYRQRLREKNKTEMLVTASVKNKLIIREFAKQLEAGEDLAKIARWLTDLKRSPSVVVVDADDHLARNRPRQIGHCNVVLPAKL